ncbi:hypothetical protein LY78DRAFT_434181 [Colletotrichum sublineola]|nr:hypothetical protein LY78DRAFT_434181 [Colletotrichum sublineola]
MASRLAQTDDLLPIVCFLHLEQNQHTKECMHQAHLTCSAPCHSVPHRRTAKGTSPGPSSAESWRAEGQPLHPSSPLRGSSALGGLGSPTPFLLHHLTTNTATSHVSASSVCVSRVHALFALGPTGIPKQPSPKKEEEKAKRENQISCWARMTRQTS